jgi:tetratricopeptide (TPR) repeat protein
MSLMTRTVPVSVALLVATLFGAGCRSRPASPTPPVGATAPASAHPSRSAAAEDARSFEEKAEADARFMAGLVHELRDEPKPGLDHLYKAALADPGNEVLVLDVSTRFILLKQYDKALSLLDKGLKQPGASAALDARQGFVYLQMGQTNAAIRASQNVIRKAPRSGLGYESLFHIYLLAGRTNEADRVLVQAAAVRNPEADFLVDLSEMYLLKNRACNRTNEVLKAQARAALEQAAKLNPTNFFVLQKLADGFAQLGDRKQAAAAYLTIQSLYPDLPTVRERLVDLFLRDRDKKGAAAQLQGLIRDDPTNPQAYYLLGILAFDDHQYAEAAEHFQKTILLKDDYEPAYYELAVSQINLDRPKEALQTLGKAREKFNDTFLTGYFSGLAHMRQKDYTNAVRQFLSAEVMASATDTNRLTHIFYFQLGSANERGGRWQDGEAYLRKCLKLAPDFAEALNYLGYMYAEKGTNLVEARQMVDQALKQEPDNAAFLDSLGWILFKLGQHAEALKLIQRAIELNKEPDAVLYDHLGDIWGALKEAGKAREAWQKALGLEPTPEIRKKLDQSGSKP